MSKVSKRIIIVLIIGIVVFGLGGIAMFTLQDAEPERGELVARVRLEGMIQEGLRGFDPAAITPRQVEEKFKEAHQNPAIKAIVMRVNSSGGSVAASQEIADIIRESELPVVVSMGDTAASGAYYISAPADKIIAQPGTLTGSIGVIISQFNPEELLDKIGVEHQVFSSGEHKDMLYRELSSEEEDILQGIVDDSHEQFVNEIITGRDLGEEEVRELATGEVFTGRQAVEHGLVDRLGGSQEALEEAAELAELEEAIYYEFREPSILQQFFAFTMNIPEVVYRAVTPEEKLLLENLQNDFLRNLEYRAPGL